LTYEEPLRGEEDGRPKPAKPARKKTADRTRLLFPVAGESAAPEYEVTSKKGSKKPAEVQILNLYVEDTIEEDTYDTLKNRIHLFEEVVGPLQPILAEMPRILRRVARGELELAETRRLLDEAAKEKPRVAIESLDSCVREPHVAASLRDANPVSERPGHVSQRQLAAWCLAHPAPGMRIITIPEPGTQFAPQDGLRGCLAITWPYAPPYLGIASDEEVLATFDGELADRHPPTGPTEGPDDTVTPGREGVRLLTWGDPLLTAWLEAIRGEPLTVESRRMAGEALSP
jgi:hypothetical protein